MIQGWHGENYLILFEEQRDAVEIARRYDVLQRLPGYSLIGLRSWDDFIVIDADFKTWTVPTIPALPSHLAVHDGALDLSSLRPDEALAGRIKWYTQPIIFGGDTTSEDNITWISLDQHIDLVRWWNQKYDEAASQKQCPIINPSPNKRI